MTGESLTGGVTDDRNSGIPYVSLHVSRVAFVTGLEKASPRRDEVGFDTLCRLQPSLSSASIWAPSGMSVSTSTSSSGQTRGSGGSGSFSGLSACSRSGSYGESRLRELEETKGGSWLRTEVLVSEGARRPVSQAREGM